MGGTTIRVESISPVIDITNTAGSRISVGMYIKGDGTGGELPSGNFHIEYRLDGGAWVTGITETDPGSVTTWTSYTFEFFNSAPATDLQLRVYMQDNVYDGAMLEIGIDTVNVRELYKKIAERTRGYGGLNTVIDGVNLTLTGVDSHLNWRVLLGDNYSSPVDRYIINNVGGAIKLNSNAVEDSDDVEVYISNNYTWQLDGTNAQLKFYDKDLIDGASHPLDGVLSLKTKFKYSTTLNGRQYVGNVKIENENGVEEEHKDWIVFSELNQLDVLPISNYINIEDLQGGEIRGLESLFGDIAVFMDRGIFRLGVDSTDPGNWTLRESIKHIGCDAPDSIEKYESGIFFASNDNMYYLTGNFEAVPITNTIQDEYQLNHTSATRSFIDIKNNRLLVRLGADVSTIYVLDLQDFRQQKESWSKFSLGASEGDADLFVASNDLTSYIIDSNTDSNIRELSPSSSSNTITAEL